MRSSTKAGNGASLTIAAGVRQLDRPTFAGVRRGLLSVALKCPPLLLASPLARFSVRGAMTVPTRRSVSPKLTRAQRCRLGKR